MIWHRRRSRPAGRADVRRTDHRGRRDCGVLRSAAAPVRAAAARCAAGHGKARSAAGGHRGQGAAAESGFHRMSLCRSLPGGTRRVPGRAARIAVADRRSRGSVCSFATACRPRLAPTVPHAVQPAGADWNSRLHPCCVCATTGSTFRFVTDLLRRVIGYVKAVDGISFELQRAARLALVGESGCGKTTTGKALLQLLRDVAKHRRRGAAGRPAA